MLWIIIAACLFAGCEVQQTPSAVGDRVTETQPVRKGSHERSLAERMGTHWHADVDRFRNAPRLTPVEIPEIPLANAVWGATGRDDAGNLYVGVSCDGPGIPSATLLKIPPGTERAVSLGDAVEQLNRLGFSEADTSQMKIHGKPVQANDGYVYFTSLDERGESEDGTVLPTWGSHLWRINPAGGTWEHLDSFEEGLIATACTGRYVYALGYFNHVLYQFDTQNYSMRRRTVGSIGAHVSRNFLVDANEHAYVPRVQRNSLGEAEGGEYTVDLIEFDPLLREVAAHPLDDYRVTPNFDSHGIVSYVALADGELLFTTSTGTLYRVAPGDENRSTLTSLGKIHPDGGSYPAVLVCPTGADLLYSLVRTQGQAGYQYLIFDLVSGEGRVQQLDTTSMELLERSELLLYGCNTLDNSGAALVVGRWADDAGVRPLVWRMQW